MENQNKNRTSLQGGGHDITLSEENLPKRLKDAYWSRLLKVTVAFFIAWSIIAVWWHIPAQTVWRDRYLFDKMPVHWYLAAFISIVVGVALIFLYTFVMKKVDESFRRLVVSELEKRSREVEGQ